MEKTINGPSENVSFYSVLRNYAESESQYRAVIAIRVKIY